MRNSAPGRCRYIRERSQPTASLLFFPGFLSGIRPAETNGPNDGRRTRHDIRCDQASNQATSVRPGEQHPTVARRQTDRRMRRADRHLKNGILAGQTATRSGLSGNGPVFPETVRTVSFCRASCGQRSAAAKRCKRPILSRNGNRFPACRYDANKTSQARETNQDGE